MELTTAETKYSLINVATGHIEMTGLNYTDALEEQSAHKTRGMPTELQIEIPGISNDDAKSRAIEILKTIENSAKDRGDGGYVASHGVAVSFDAAVTYQFHEAGKIQGTMDYSTAVATIAAQIERDNVVAAPLPKGLPGEILPNGAIVIQRMVSILLCVIPGNTQTPYVTWRFKSGSTSSGKYFHDLDDAVASLKLRSAR